MTKSDKQYACVVMYFVELIKCKLSAAHYNYFYPKKYFDKN